MKLERVWLAPLAAVSLLTTAPAAATIFTVTYTGVVTTGTDSNGVFSKLGGPLDGQAYTASFKINDSVGVRYTSELGGLDSVIGGNFNGNATPSLGATLTISGQTFAFNGLSLGLQSNYPASNEISSYASDTGAPGMFDASFLGNSLTTANAPVPMAQAFSATGTPAKSGYTNSFQIAFGPLNGTHQYASGTLAPSSVTVTIDPVPEPATWAMMVGGFGLIGGTLRRKRVSVQFA